MHILRYIIGAFVAVVPLTWAAITYFPGIEYVAHAGAAIELGVVALFVLTVIAVYTEGRLAERGKTLLMIGFLIAVLGPTLYTAGAYIHQLNTSWSGGEVHFHADYEVIVQDENGDYHQLDLIDPSDFCEATEHESSYMCKLNDRTGAVEYHEHNDRRIHLEGTFRDREDATLSAFFATFGGKLTNTELVYPTNDRTWEVSNQGNNTLKIILERGVGGSRGWCAIGAQGEVPDERICIDSYNDERAHSPDEYVVSPYQTGPPLDDIWLIYDDASLAEALQDLEDDGRYKQFEQEKTAGSEGY